MKHFRGISASIFHAVANAPDGFNHASVPAQLLPQGSDVHIYRSGLRAVLRIPDLLAKLLPGKYRPRLGKKQLQQVKLLGGQLDFSPARKTLCSLRLTVRSPIRSKPSSCFGWVRRSTALTRDTSSIMPKGLVR